MMNFRKGKTVVWICFCLLLTAAAVGANTAGSLPPSEDITVQEDFTYDSSDRRDPFAPLINEIVPSTGKAQRALGPLEKFNLNEFHLMAMMVVKGAPHAMVKAPDGKSYTVKLGDLMGANGGIVKRIETKTFELDAETGVKIEKSPDRIVVEETMLDNFTGKTVKKEFYIEM